jgi:4-amino-4-deoxy-L-arabinose transferase-like glycosyltransferase
MRWKTLRRFLPAGVLTIHAGLLAYGAAVHSPCIDEVGHMAAGLSHWQLGRFDLYHVNPPLVRMVAAVPVLFAQPKTDWSEYSDAPGARSEFEIGRQFITDNGERSFWFFTWARWACIPFSLLGGYICFRWARDLYGEWSGLLALTLWCFGPNILANGQMITPDMGATALGVTAAYVFWKWLKQPSWRLCVASGLTLGLALLTKATWIILFGLWPALWLLWQTSRASGGRQPPDPPRPWRGGALQLATTLLLGLYVLNTGYGFEGSFDRLGDYQFVSETLGGPRSPGVIIGQNRFASNWLGVVPMPVPRNYLLGIDAQKHDFESRYWSYLRGEWRQQGWWYYYLYGLAVKVPLGVWCIAILAVVLALTWRGYAASWRDELTLLAPAAAVLMLVSAETGFNHHLRYVLPIFPFCFVWISKAARYPPTLPSPRCGGGLGGGAWAAVLTGAAIAWAVGSSLWVYPHSLSYFNELAGGPENGSAHLVDSNIDWGQDLFFLRDWLKAHPEARPIKLAYFGFFDPRVAGIEFTPPPPGPTRPGDTSKPDAQEEGPHPGWFAVSMTMLRGYEYSIHDGRGGLHGSPLNNYTYFQRFQPVGRAGWSIYIYHITPQKCAQERRKMDLPALTAPTDGSSSEN